MEQWPWWIWIGTGLIGAGLAMLGWRTLDWRRWRAGVDTDRMTLRELLTALQTAQKQDRESTERAIGELTRVTQEQNAILRELRVDVLALQGTEQIDRTAKAIGAEIMAGMMRAGGTTVNFGDVGGQVGGTRLGDAAAVQGGVAGRDRQTLLTQARRRSLIGEQARRIKRERQP